MCKAVCSPSKCPPPEAFPSTQHSLETHDDARTAPRQRNRKVLRKEVTVLRGGRSIGTEEAARPRGKNSTALAETKIACVELQVSVCFSVPLRQRQHGSCIFVDCTGSRMCGQCGPRTPNSAHSLLVLKIRPIDAPGAVPPPTTSPYRRRLMFGELYTCHVLLIRAAEWRLDSAVHVLRPMTIC